MQRERQLRATAIAGGVFAAGTIGTLLTPAFHMPASDAPAADFAQHFADHRTELLLICWSGAIGQTFVIAVLVALTALLRDRAPLTAATGLVAGTMTVAMTVCGFAVLAALAYVEPEPGAARDGAALAWVFINLAAGPSTTLSIGAYTLALARGEHGRAWLVPLGVVVAAAHLVVAGAFAREGFLSVHGGVAYVVPALYALWVAAASLVVWRAAARGPDQGRLQGPPLLP